MNGFTTMLKMNIRLLLRNKGYLGFLFVLPLIAVLFLNLPNENAYIDNDDGNLIYELKSIDQTMLDMVNTKINIKVFDASASVLSDYVLEELAKTGFVNVYRYKIEDLTIKEVEVQAINMANKSSFAAAIYIPADFDQKFLEGRSENLLVLYELLEDGRIEILKTYADTFIQNLSNLSSLVNGDVEELYTFIEDIRAQEIEKEIVSVEIGDSLSLDNKQRGQTNKIGYSLGVVTLSFISTGIFIASIIVEEKHKVVLTRILLTNASISNYIIIKMILAIFTVIIQTAVMGIGILLFVKTDFGISIGSYLLFIGGVGLIYNFLSIAICAVIGNVLSASYTAYFCWSISGLLSGLYFSTNNMPDWFNRVSLLMPQRWVIRSSEVLLTGGSNVYSIFLMVMLGFLAIIFCAGLVGIKINNKE